MSLIEINDKLNSLRILDHDSTHCNAMQEEGKKHPNDLTGLVLTNRIYTSLVFNALLIDNT